MAYELNKYMKKLVNGIEVDWSADDEQQRIADEQRWTAYLEQEKYKEDRRQLYPSAVDQLDMIYKDTINGTTVWKDLITSIKVRYPKSS